MNPALSYAEITGHYIKFSAYRGVGIRNYISEVSTSQERQIFIFARQLDWSVPQHIFPLINQQSLPALYCQAGQFFFCLGGHFFMIQQGLRCALIPLFLESRKKICLSTCAGTFRQPCS